MTDGWEVLEERELLNCPPWVRVRLETVRLEDDQTVVPDFYMIDLPDFVMIFAVSEVGQVALVEQYRHAIGRRTVELPAGVIDTGETPLEAAQRELREETGLEAASWVLLGSFVIDPNRGCGRGYAYLATGARPTDQPAEQGDLQGQTLRMVTPDELRQMWLGGEIKNMSTAAAVGLGLAQIARLDGA